MKRSLPILLSVNGGYVDTAGFLALHGLFTTHVTGNFVTLGAAWVLGTSGAVAKLLALPVFCVVVVATRLSSLWLSGTRLPSMRSIMGCKVFLLIAAAGCAISWGPFDSGDGWRAVLTGMTLVAAMAVQNAAHRIYMSTAPPTTIMTGNTTQIMIDVADLWRGVPADVRAAIHSRFSRMLGSVAAFAAGCAAAAMVFANQGVWCFLVPPIIAACALSLLE